MIVTYSVREGSRATALFAEMSHSMHANTHGSTTHKSTHFLYRHKTNSTRRIHIYFTGIQLVCSLTTRTEACKHSHKKLALSISRWTFLLVVNDLVVIHLHISSLEVEPLRGRESERRKERESKKESAWDCKSVTKASHWFRDGELMKPRQDMTVQCQTGKSYAGRRALGAISLQIVVSQDDKRRSRRS